MNIPRNLLRYAWIIIPEVGTCRMFSAHTRTHTTHIHAELLNMLNVIHEISIPQFTLLAWLQALAPWHHARLQYVVHK